MALDIWQSHLGLVLAIFLLLPSMRWSRTTQLAALAALGLVSCIEFNGLALAAYLRSIIGQLAITSVLLMVAAVLARLRLLGRMVPAQRWQITLVFAALGLALYPAAAGLTQFDPYRLGYDPELLLAVIGALAAWLIVGRNHWGAWLLALATLAFVFDLKDSANYWDYLLDPLLVTFCWAAVLQRSYRVLRQRAGKTVAMSRAVQPTESPEPISISPAMTE